jgi:hypothetical protein
MVFGGALEGRELSDCLFNNVKGLLNLLLGDDQRRGKTDDVLVSGFGL